MVVGCSVSRHVGAAHPISVLEHTYDGPFVLVVISQLANKPATRDTNPPPAESPIKTTLSAPAYVSLMCFNARIVLRGACEMQCSEHRSMVQCGAVRVMYLNAHGSCLESQIKTQSILSVLYVRTEKREKSDAKR